MSPTFRGSEGFRLLKVDVSDYISIPGPGRLCFAFRLAGFASRLRRASDRDDESWFAGNAAHARAGEGEGRPLPAGVDLGVVRRPACPSAARELLGKRQSGRAPGVLRRGEALRRGTDHLVPDEAPRQHRDHADLQHIRPADASERRPRDSELRQPGAVRRLRSRFRATAARRGRCATSTTWSRGRCGCCSPISPARSTSAIHTR